MNEKMRQLSGKMSSNHDDVQKLYQICSKHPVLQLVVHQENLETNVTLRKFIEERIATNDTKFTLTEFCSSFLDHRLQTFYSYSPSRHIKLVYHLGKDTVLDILGYLALHAVILLNRNITENDLTNSFKSAKTQDELDAYLMGLLERVGSNESEYVFKDRFIQQFLVARYQFRILLDQKMRYKSEVKLDKWLKKSAKLLPATNDVWVMTFALLFNDGDMKIFQGSVYTEIMRLNKKYKLLQNSLMFSLQIAFEANSPAAIQYHIAALTDNEYVDLSALYLQQHRRLYVLSVLGHMIHSASNLYGLKLSGFGIGVENIEQLVGPCNQVSENSLQELDLSNNPLGPQGITRMLRFFAKSAKLTALDLSGCRLGDDGLILLSELLMLTPLVSLRMRDNAITEEGGRVLLGQLLFCASTLHTLDLSCNLLDDDWLLILMQHLNAYRSLASLDLRDNCVSAQGQEAISEILTLRQKHSPGITPLTIYACNQKPVCDGEVGFFDDFVAAEMREKLSRESVCDLVKSQPAAVSVPCSMSSEAQIRPDVVPTISASDSRIILKPVVDIKKERIQRMAHDIGIEHSLVFGDAGRVIPTETQLESTPVNNTRRESIYKMRADFFSCSSIGLNPGLSTLEKSYNRRRSSIGGGALERMKTIERSSRKSLGPAASLAIFHEKEKELQLDEVSFQLGAETLI